MECCMTDLRCPHCQQTANLAFHAQDTNRRLSNAQFDYYRCSTCGLIFLHPIPEGLSSYYDQSYHRIPATLEALGAIAQTRRDKLATIQRFVPRGSLLEIGPSYGDLAYPAKQAGYSVDAIEMDADCVRFLNEVVGVNALHSADPLAVLKTLGQYDVIVLWHVIEHLPDVWSVLAEAAQHLTPKGILVLAAPNPDAVQFKLFGAKWAHLDAPRHLQLIPIRALTEYLGEQGLNCEQITTSNRDNLGIYEPFGWKKSIMNVLGVYVPPPTLNGDQPRTAAPKRSPSYYAKRLVLRAAAGGLSLLSLPWVHGRLGGSAYTLVFQKPQG
jgi:2-polyprenyl-3-methyl-5-hydroxy-6-metoxy-1,4-benzoquinol methylase